MKNHTYRTEKARRDADRLEAMKELGNETLTEIADIIIKSIRFYDDCMKSWDSPNDKANGEKWSAEEIEKGRMCTDSGLNIAGDIVNEMRIKYLQK